MSEERRAFRRIGFEADARLTDQQGRALPVRVLDLSLHGALLAVEGGWQGEDGVPLELHITLDAGHQILMQGRQRHHAGVELGLECEHMDLDSASNLRRLVELNLGDDQLLQRQLEQLIGTR